MARILLVDDDRDLLLVASNLLRLPIAGGAGHVVVTCENAMEAIEHARKEEFDVVITDANMTPHTGYDLIRSLKQIPGYDMIPIAMLTGRRERRDVERALAVGAQDYIVKPIDPERFVAKVSELVHKAESNRRAVRFAEIDVNESATIELGLLVLSISETGCLLDSDHRLREGTRIRMDSPIFQRIGLGRPMVKVSSCAPGAIENMFEVRATFIDLDERAQTKLRTFIQSRVKARVA